MRRTAHRIELGSVWGLHQADAAAHRHPGSQNGAHRATASLAAGVDHEDVARLQAFDSHALRVREVELHRLGDGVRDAAVGHVGALVQVSAGRDVAQSVRRAGHVAAGLQGRDAVHEGIVDAADALERGRCTEHAAGQRGWRLGVLQPRQRLSNALAAGSR